MADAERERPTKRPTTPLQRISRGSLRSHSLALSASRSRSQSRTSRPSSPLGRSAGGTGGAGAGLDDDPFADSDPCPALNHLAPLFDDLRDAFADLHANLDELATVQQNLAGFNEAFGGFIYGLRMNAYTTDFPEAPTLASFKRAAERREREAEDLAKTVVPAGKGHEPASPTGFASTRGAAAGNETTFMSNRDDLSTLEDDLGAAPSSRLPRGGGIPTARGRGATSSVRGRGGSAAATKAAQQKAHLRWAGDILPALPIKYREQQPHRGEMERVLILLKTHPNGLYVPDFTKLDATLPVHRARECVNALVASKHAVKVNKNGLLYQLDERALTSK